VPVPEQDLNAAAPGQVRRRHSIRRARWSQLAPATRQRTEQAALAAGARHRAADRRGHGARLRRLPCGGPQHGRDGHRGRGRRRHRTAARAADRRRGLSEPLPIHEPSPSPSRAGLMPAWGRPPDPHRERVVTATPITVWNRSSDPSARQPGCPALPDRGPGAGGPMYPSRCSRRGPPPAGERHRPGAWRPSAWPSSCYWPAVRHPRRPPRPPRHRPRRPRARPGHRRPARERPRRTT
jgi:hypothetical protein